jgi:hypothetical protein
MTEVAEKEILIEVRTLAKEKIESGNEPPGTWLQYWELIETIDAILSGMGTVTCRGNLRQSNKHK